MPKIQANGIEMYYEVHGRGRPLVFIMGLRRNAEWWYRQIPDLSAAFQVVVFDNRGAGRTDKPAMDYSIPLFADDTAALLDGLGLDCCHVLGVSMGGYIAQELALRHPERVESLVLGCSSPGGELAVPMSPERREKFTAIEGLTPEQILRKDMDIYFSEAFVRDHPDRIEEFIRISMRHYQPAEAFVRQFEACLKHDTADRLGRIAAPTLIVHGDDDSLVPPVNSDILARLIPGSEKVLIPGGRHAFFMEFDEMFNRKVIDFINGLG
ncbi:MAG: alpha/beta hydrolase [Proteobacteria bacterium]|nr:alpha/beta hydrolase [Pseudomonadota bacterium]